MADTALPLSVEGLCKDYPKFSLRDVSFSVESGEICGFIGRNGAGKSTALKSILNLLHASAGSIRYFGTDLTGHEREIKQIIGFSGGAVDYYKKKKIRDIAAVTRTFYDNWDDAEYRRFLTAFELDEDKSPAELSEGMKIKFNLALALSHRAKLLILDEPTSGLDPFSRAELLDIFRSLADAGVAILFSTHIITDIEKCADRVIYIRRGRIVASEKKEAFIARFAAAEAEGLEDIMLRLEKEGGPHA